MGNHWKTKRKSTVSCGPQEQALLTSWGLKGERRENLPTPETEKAYGEVYPIGTESFSGKTQLILFHSFFKDKITVKNNATKFQNKIAEE